MFDAHDFFKNRLSAHMKEISRYLRYIFNGHMAFAIIFFIAALAYYYQAWLAQLPKTFPSAWVIGIAFGLVASYSPVTTLLKEPDLVFLIPVEHRMGPYFRNALIYSFVVQLYLVLVVVAALGPLYFHSFSERTGKMYLLTILVLLIFKGWSLLAHWWMLRIRDVGVRRIDIAVRLLLNVAVFYFVVDGEMLFAGIGTLLFVAKFLYDWGISRKQAGLAWDVLLEKDQHRMQAFYRLANMFTDVPHLKHRVRKRHWLVALLKRVPFSQNATYDYLYRITLVRGGDYLGMYVRLIVIGGLAIYFIPNIWVKLIFGMLFVYMACFQLMTLYQHRRAIMWLDLYPVDKRIRQRALLALLRRLGLVHTAVFTVVFLASAPSYGALFMFAGGVLFTIAFIRGYVQRKIA